MPSVSRPIDQYSSGERRGCARGGGGADERGRGWARGEGRMGPMTSNQKYK